MPTIKVPQIELPSIEIPETPYFTKHKLEGQIPGCNLFHRDLKVTRNPSLLISDKNGTFTTCPEGQIPSYDPIRFDMNELIYTESNPVQNEAKRQKTKVKPSLKEKKKEEETLPCPSKKNQRVGDFRNEKRLERVVGHKRGEDGIECITLYEDITFIDSVLPSPSAALNVVTISLIAATTPLLLPIIKSLSKTIFKKILAKFDKGKKNKVR